MLTPEPIKLKDRDAILQSLRSGVVPRRGLQHIQVGRANEVVALNTDLDRVADGGTCFRLLIGEFGAGKSFFLSVIRQAALAKKLVTVHADLSPDRRLHASGGQARSLYAELLRNAATRGTPDGGALASIVELFVTTARQEAERRGCPPDTVIAERLNELTQWVGGYDFARVIALYWRGHEQGNDDLKANAVRWLRGEFTTKTDARNALGVRTIVDDTNIYDQLKLFARFVRLAGLTGLVVCLDELVNLYKLANTASRSANYEQLLRILNDCLQGSVEGLGFLGGGTPEFLTDTRKGLFSYPALASRLAENRFATGGLLDLSGPVLRLANLTPVDMGALLFRLRHVQASGDPSRYLVDDEGLRAFLEHCQRQVGEAYYRTPRNTIKAFLDLLAVLEQNPQVDWPDLVAGARVAPEANLEHLAPEITDEEGAVGDDELTSFRL